MKTWDLNFTMSEPRPAASQPDVAVVYVDGDAGFGDGHMQMTIQVAVGSERKGTWDERMAIAKEKAKTYAKEILERLERGKL